MKNTKKILLGYLFAMMFVLGVTMVGCGSDDDDCSGKAKPATGDCSSCTEDTSKAGYCA